jgi:formylglycine-generating enzyme required for sulfatase activity
MKTSILFLAFCCLSISAGAEMLHVDSVTVDSVWNSDSFSLPNRDCIISFMPMGGGMARCSLFVSLDSGKSWYAKDSFSVLDTGLVHLTACGTKGRVTVRIPGGDRTGIVIKMTARQEAPVVTGAPKKIRLGFSPAAALKPLLWPDSSTQVVVRCKLNDSSFFNGYSNIDRLQWDWLGDGTWDDSTSGTGDSALWTWNTKTPPSPLGQRRTVIARARDGNGLYSLPETLSVQFGIVPITMIDSTRAGTFLMGSTRDVSESPVHSVTLTAFKISATPITQDQYEAVMGVNPSHFDSNGTYPVEQVTWFDAVLFCNALSRVLLNDTVVNDSIFRDSITKKLIYSYTGIPVNPGNGCTELARFSYDINKAGFRLPTEAEWEYACRAGTTTEFFWGDSQPPLTPAETLAMDSNVVWFGNSDKHTWPVGGKKPNNWLLYDMAGNVMQWCNDYYALYGGGAQTDPLGPADQTQRVLRGGSYTLVASDTRGYLYRSASRYMSQPGDKGGSSGFGFRIVAR